LHHEEQAYISAANHVLCRWMLKTSLKEPQHHEASLEPFNISRQVHF
jgi:hypothetical protein